MAHISCTVRGRPPSRGMISPARSSGDAGALASAAGTSSCPPFREPQPRALTLDCNVSRAIPSAAASVIAPCSATEEAAIHASSVSLGCASCTLRYSQPMAAGLSHNVADHRWPSRLRRHHQHRKRTGQRINLIVPSTRRENSATHRSAPCSMPPEPSPIPIVALRRHGIARVALLPLSAEDDTT